MHWADRIAKEIIASGHYKPYLVDDMFTPSGYAHVGSLRGPLIHDFIFKSLQSLGEKPQFTFVFNDFDPIDGLPAELMDKFSKYLGYPLRLAPSPFPGHKSFGEYFAQDFEKVLKKLEVHPKIFSSWEMYHEGKFDEVIKIALDNASKIQDIYQKVSGSKKKEKGWLPFQVICESCQKLGTTRVFDWDGEKVSYKCERQMVSWAKGCGHEGKISPFGGTGKLPWKVDWAAHWKVMGVTVEGAGKDHASAGGSYDIAMAICREVFKYPQPYKFAYEFFLIGGKKMASSKGLGLKARELVEVLPPDVVRFLFTRTNFKKAIEFNPIGTMAIPDLFDEYDRVKRKKEKISSPRFRDVVNYLQQPSVDIKKVFPGVEKKNLEERIEYAKMWLGKYAPLDLRLGISEKLPKVAKGLTKEQREYLAKTVHLVEVAKEPEKLQTELYNLAKSLKIHTKDAFAAIYLSFIGRGHGPKAAWFLLSYPKEKVIRRLKEASQ